MKVSGQSHEAATYLRCTLSRRLGGPTADLGVYGEEVNLLRLLGVKSRTVQPIA